MGQSLGHCGGEILGISSLQNKFRASVLALWRICEHGLLILHQTQHLSEVQVQTLTRPFENFYFITFEPFSDVFVLMPWIVFFLHNPVALELKLTEWWPNLLLQDFLSESRIYPSLNYHPSPEATKHSHFTLLHPYLTESMLFYWFSADVTVAPTFQEALLCTQSTEYSTKM